MSYIDWKDSFDEIFEECSDKWKLINVHRNDVNQIRKLQSKRTMTWTKYARFHCPKCSNQWASAKAMVVFYYPNKGERIGLVQMRFLGQQCRQCSRKSDYYVDPEFEDDSIQIILKKLYEKIGWDCYGKARPAKSNIHKDRPNQIQGPHEKNLCEACHLGCCDRN